MAAKQSFVVWAPYQTDSEMLSRRTAARTEHLAGLKQLGAQGSLSVWCGFFDGSPHSLTHSVRQQSSAGRQAKGSMLIYEAESAAVVRGFLEKDPYWAGNVWDKEKLEIRAIVLTIQ
ncbi:hypothetical protein H4582DRAFT_1808495 [Lactarius indigo]|nr:hypothetical protein H4582DRAFT_1808495 [Lactarius indigo]